MEQPKEYYAFISYKREDKKEAKRLQHALEYYRLPNHLRQENPELPEYVRPVFRDMTNLEVGELSAQIHAGLEQSHFLIVVCSPRAAASKWVNDEVEYFISLGKQDKIIPYIIEGVPHASNLSEECYPPALLTLSKEKELLGANINEVGKDSATIRVVSRMFNIRFDTLYQRYQREQKQRRIHLTIAIGLAFLFLFGIVGWIWHQNSLLKEREWKIMEYQARAIAEKASFLIDEGNAYLASLFAVKVLPKEIQNPDRPYIPEVEHVLRRSLLQRDAVFYLENNLIHKYISFSPTGEKIIVAAPLQNNITVLETESGAVIKPTKEDEYNVYSNLLSPDRKVYLAEDYVSDTIVIFIKDEKTDEDLLCLKGNTKGVVSKGFSPDGKKIITSSWDGTICLWDSKKGNILNVLKGHKGDVNYASFSPDGKKIVSASSDKTVKIWNTETGKCIHTLIGHSAGINHATFSSDGKMIVSSSSDKTIRIWDSDTGLCLRILRGHLDGVCSSAFSHNGKKIVSVSYDHTIRLWNLGQIHKEDVVNRHDVISFAVYNERIITYASMDNIIHVWDIKTGKDIKILKGHKDSIKQIAISPDKKYIASASKDKTIRIWDVQTGKEIQSLFGHTESVNSIAFSPDGKQVVSASSDKTVRFWDVKSGKCNEVYKWHNKKVNYISFSPNGKYVVSASAGKTMCFLDTKKCLWYDPILKYVVNTVSFNPSGDYIVSASNDSTIRIWDVETESVVKTIEGGNSVHSAFFSPSGKRIVSAHNDGTIKVWDTETGKNIHTIEGYTGKVYLASFMPNETKIISVSADNILRVWEFPPLQDLINKTRERFKNRQLTLEERKMFYLE